jgi:hypothetical protein
MDLRRKTLSCDEKRMGASSASYATAFFRAEEGLSPIKEFCTRVESMVLIV